MRKNYDFPITFLVIFLLNILIMTGILNNIKFFRNLFCFETFIQFLKFDIAFKP